MDCSTTFRHVHLSVEHLVRHVDSLPQPRPVGTRLAEGQEDEVAKYTPDRLIQKYKWRARRDLFALKSPHEPGHRITDWAAEHCNEKRGASPFGAFPVHHDKVISRLQPATSTRKAAPGLVEQIKADNILHHSATSMDDHSCSNNDLENLR